MPGRLISCAGMTCHARRELFVPKLCNIFSVLSTLKYNPDKTNNKFIITSQSFLSGDVILTSSKRKRRIVYGSVTRYGPRASCQRKGVNFQNCNIFSVLSITRAKRIINLLLLNNFYPVISYCIRFGHSLRSAISCQRKCCNMFSQF